MTHRLLLLRDLDRVREIGPLAVRLFTAFVLIYGTQDNVFDRGHMAEFSSFLAQNGFPMPVVAAHLSAYAQFLAGLLILIGLLTRWAALAMVINFVVALGMVHVGLPFSANISPLAMLTTSIFLLLYGPGILSVDERLLRRRGESDAYS